MSATFLATYRIKEPASLRAAEMLRELRLAVNDLGLKDRLQVRRESD